MNLTKRRQEMVERVEEALKRNNMDAKNAARELRMNESTVRSIKESMFRDNILK